MTAGILDRPAVCSERAALDGSGTLEELLTSAFAEVRANGSTECPVCHARMSSTRAREAAAAGAAECGGCGSRLS
jgi:hypothetical protein